MSSYKSFKNYSFSNSLKSFTDPFQQLLKRPATSTPSALFTPTKPPATPALNFTPIPPNMSTNAGPVYAPPSTPTIGSGAGSTKPPVSATTSQTKPIVPQVAPAASPTAPPVATGTTQGTSQDAPGAFPTPATPQVLPEAQKALDLAEKAYADSQKLSSNELSTQEDIDKLIESTKTAYRNTSGQAIPLEFITGQLRSIEQRATGLAEPLDRKLARMQATRQASIEGSKFALDRADRAIAGERSRVETARTEAESARRFGITTGLTEKSQAQRKLEADRKFKQDEQQFGLNYAIKQRETAVKEKKAAAKGTEAISPYQTERGRRNLQSVDELVPRVSDKTVGLGSYANLIRGTDAYNFKSDLDTLKANVAFGELTAMREASKTGGALGQVSDREAQLLQAALGSLDPGQSPENFTKNLNKIKDSINRWYSAVDTSSSSTGGSFTSPSGTTFKLPY
mgnify:CR=1 FL=1